MKWRVDIRVACAVVAIGCAGERSAVEDASAQRGQVAGATSARQVVYDAGRDSVYRDSVARARQDSINRTLPGYVIDSILPVAEELRRFRAAVGGTTVSVFEGASETRDALVRRFVTAIQASDTNELRAMVVNAREFADLIYPETRQARSQFHQSPALTWRMIQTPSASGITRLMHRLGGKPLTLSRYSCDDPPELEGTTRYWTGCQLWLAGPSGRLVGRRLFGSILERDHQFKFMSYRNEF